jgi:hypothetical protein
MWRVRAGISEFLDRPFYRGNGGSRRTTPRAESNTKEVCASRRIPLGTSQFRRYELDPLFESASEAALLACASAKDREMNDPLDLLRITMQTWRARGEPLRRGASGNVSHLRQKRCQRKQKCRCTTCPSRPGRPELRGAGTIDGDRKGFDAQTNKLTKGGTGSQDL